MTKVIISLSTIPPRFSGLHDCLVSLLAQTAHIDAINVYVPRHYRRFPDAFGIPEVPAGVTVKVIDHDYGPATKVLPAAAENMGTDTFIIYCDDDKMYHKNWAKHLISCAQAHAGCAITATGQTISQCSFYTWQTDKMPSARRIRKDLLYRARRAASMGLWKPDRKFEPGYTDILCGWAGCVVRPEFFVEQDFSIPDVLWTVDDVWLSGCLEKNGVPIWQEKLSSDLKPQHASNDFPETALMNFVHRGYDRARANHECVRYFREKHGIWGG